MGLDPSHQMTEREIHEYHIPEDVGVHWRDLARALKFFQHIINTIKLENGNNLKECCTDLLVKWMNREGRDATAGILAEALRSIGLKNVADTLICPNSGPSQTREFEEIREKVISLESEVSKMSTRIKELEEKQRLRDRPVLEEAVVTKPEPLQDTLEGSDQETRELTFRGKLKDINKRLYNYVTCPLEVPEVNQDQLTTPVKIDLLTKVTRRLQELYSAMQALTRDARQCSDVLRRDYLDLAYNGLRAPHNDLIHRINDLESVEEKMSEEEKGNFQMLQTYQVNRQKQVEMLETLWRTLFKSPEHLPKTPVSQPLATSEKPSNSKKVSRYTDPGTRPKQPKSGGEFASTKGPSSSNEEREEKVCLNFTQPKSAVGTIKSFLRRKKNDGKQCSVVSYTPRRDS